MATVRAFLALSYSTAGTGVPERMGSRDAVQSGWDSLQHDEDRAPISAIGWECALS